MGAKAYLKELITTIVELTVEHYVDEYTIDDNYHPSTTIREIKGDCIESMENDLIDKLYDAYLKRRTNYENVS